MVAKKWVIAGAAGIAVLTAVSIFALMNRDDSVSRAGSDDLNWSSADLSAKPTDGKNGNPLTDTTPGVQNASLGNEGFTNNWPSSADNGFVLLETPDLEKALKGAVKGDEAGLADLQNYLDSALGDEPILRRLASRLLDGLSSSPIRNDYVAMVSASQRVAEGVARSLASAYRVNYDSTSDFAPEKTAKGWDFGPSSNKLPKHFARVAPGSKEINTQKVAAFDLKSGSAPFSDGLTGVTSFKTALGDGVYRVLVVSGPLADGSLPSDPFGRMSTGGRKLRMVDATRNMPDAEVRFSSAGINYYVPTMDVATVASGIAPINAAGGRLVKLGTGKGRAGNGELLVTRAKVENGAMTLDFTPPAGGQTYIVALMVQNSDYSAFEKDLQEQIAALMSSIETEAGSDSRGTNTGFRGAGPSPFQIAFNNPNSNAGRPGSSSGGSSGSSSGGWGGGSSGGFIGSSGGSSGSGSSGSGGSGSGSSSSTSGGGSSSSGSSSSTSGGDTGSSGSSSSTSGGDTGSSGSSSSTSGGDTGSSGSSSSTSGGDTGSSGSSSSTSGGDTGSSGSSSSTSGGDTGSSGSSSSTSGGDTGSSGSSSSTSGGDTGSSGSSSSTSGGDTGSSGSSSSTSGGDTGSSGSSSSTSGGDTGSSGSSSSTSGGDTSSSGSSSSSSSSSGADGSSSSSTSGGPDAQEALKAEAGNDQILSLGSSFFLDGCNSTFNGGLLCDFLAENSASDFDITWTYNDQIIASGIQATVASGPDSLFTNTGDYLLTLVILYTGGSAGQLKDFDLTKLTFLDSTAIPVTGTIGLFGLGLLGLGLRRRK